MVTKSASDRLSDRYRVASAKKPAWAAVLVISVAASRIAVLFIFCSSAFRPHRCGFPLLPVAGGTVAFAICFRTAFATACFCISVPALPFKMIHAGLRVHPYNRILRAMLPAHFGIAGQNMQKPRLATTGTTTVAGRLE